MTWHVSVWGTTQLGRDGSDVALRPRERAVLAALLLDHPTVVTVDQLIERLWGNDPPTSAPTALRNHVSRIRSVAAGLIVTEGGGYRLDASVSSVPPTPGQLAATEPFSELVDHVDVVMTGRIAERRRRLDERFRELRGDGGADDLSGRLAEVEQFVEVHPEHAGGAELLARALAAAGRRGDAIAVVGAAARESADAGVQPDRSLRDLERRLLDDDPTLRTSTPPSEARARSVAEGHLIEFDEHLEVLEVAAEEGTTRLVLVTGPAGIGKTTLVEQVRDRAHLHGRMPMLVSCSPEPSVPLEPIVDLLQQLAVRFPSQLEANADVRALRALAPAIALSESAQAPGLPPDRLAIFAAVAEALALAPTPLVVIVEDLHWATRLTSQIIATCAAAASDGAEITIIGTARVAPSDLMALAAEQVVLEPWRPEVVAEYVARFGGTESWVADASKWVHRQSGGNALHVRELTVSAHAEAGRRTGGNGDEFEAPVDAPPNLLASLRRALSTLPASTRRDLGAAAVLGRRLRRDEWAAMGVDVDRVMPDAVHAGVIVSTSPATSTSHDVEFRHDLLHQLVLDELSAGQRTEWHDLASDAISRSTTEPIELVDRAGELARHALGAVGLDPRRAVTALIRSIDADIERFAYESAIEACRVGLELTAPGGPATDGSRSVEFEVRLGKLLLRTGDPGALEQLLSAAEHALATGDELLMAEAIRETCRLGPTSIVGSVDATARGLLERASSEVADPQANAIIATAGVMLFAISGEYQRCRAYFEDAVRYHGDPATRADALSLAVLVLTESDDIDRRVELERELTDLASTLGTSDAVWGAAHLRMTNQVQLGDPGQRETLDHLGALATRSRQRARLWEYRNWSASVALTDGDPDLAELRATEALECLDAVAESLVMSAYGAQLLSIRHAQGRVGELLETVQSIVDDGDPIGAWHAVLALAAAGTGDADLARRELDHVCADDFAALDPDYTYNGALFAAALAACDIGAFDAAARIETELVHWSGRWAFVGTCVMGPVDVALARLAALRGDTDVARDCGERARRSAVTAAAPIYVAHADEVLGGLSS